MQVFETLVTVGHEARRFTETVQRFIEARSDDPEFAVSVKSEPLGDREHKVITFWNDEAGEAFCALWRSA